MSTRLFTAVDLAAAAREAVVAEQRRLGRVLGTSTLRWVPRDQLHVTLVFLGEVPDERVPAVLAALSPPLAVAPFPLEIGGVGVFPARGRSRALWLGLRKGSVSLRAVHDLVMSRLAGLDLDLADRAFTPHLTIGRFRGGGRVDRRRSVSTEGGPVVAVEMVRETTLVRSRLSSAGAEHTVLLRSPLAGPALH